MLGRKAARMARAQLGIRGVSCAPEAREYLGAAFLPYDYIARPGLEISGSDEAMRASAVWACVDQISTTIATLPYEAYRRDAQGISRLIMPRPRIIESPHPDMSRVDWLTQMMVSLLLRGNAYGLVVGRDWMGFPSTILPLDPGTVSVTGGYKQPITYRVNGQLVSKEDMLHIRGITMPGKWLGLSVIDHARTTIGASLATDRFANEYFSEGLAPSGVLEVADDLSAEDADQLSRDFEARHGRSRRPVVLTNGAQWKPMSITPEESQFLATREFQVVDIARLFHVPAVMVGATEKSTSFGAGMAALMAAYDRMCIGGWLVRIETGLTSLLPRGQYVRGNTAALTRGTAAEQMALLNQGISAGIWSRNECRAMLDLPPVDGGDVYYVSNLLVPAAGQADLLDELGEDPTDEDGAIDGDDTQDTTSGDVSGAPGLVDSTFSTDNVMLDPIVGADAPNVSD